MVAHLKGTAAESIDFIITEKNHVDQDYAVFHQSIDHLPEMDLNDWTRYSLHQQQDQEEDDNAHFAIQNGVAISVEVNSP